MQAHATHSQHGIHDSHEPWMARPGSPPLAERPVGQVGMQIRFPNTTLVLVTASKPWTAVASYNIATNRKHLN